MEILDPKNINITTGTKNSVDGFSRRLETQVTKLITWKINQKKTFRPEYKDTRGKQIEESAKEDTGYGKKL